MAHFDGKVAIITGAASGIGKEIAFTYAREGANVAIADLVKSAADETAEQIRQAGGQAIGVLWRDACARIDRLDARLLLEHVGKLTHNRAVSPPFH